MHTFGIMLAAAGQFDRYEVLQQSQARIQCKGDENPVLPSLAVSPVLEPFCHHPLCQLVQRHATERLKERQQVAPPPALNWVKDERGPVHVSLGDDAPPPATGERASNQE